MLIDKYRPVFAPDLEGTGAVDDQTPDPGAPPPSQVDDTPVDDDQADGPGSGRSKLRGQLEKNFATDRRDDAKRERGQKGRYVARTQDEPDPAALQDPAADPAVDPQAPAPVQTNPPDAWTKEAKAEWAKIPPTVQAAVLKRETDVAKGVEEIKKRYAGLDQVFNQQRVELIRANNQSPAQAVDQLFSWMEALGQDRGRIQAGQAPIAFRALAETFGIDPRAIVGGQPQPQPGQDPDPSKGQPQPQEEPAYVKQLREELAYVKQAVGAQSSEWERQSRSKTEEILGNWSKGKEHYEDVRGMMAHLLASGAVPPLPNGTADLDKAYETAIWALPEVRAKVIAGEKAKEEAARKAKEVAERKAQQDQINKARRASGSLALSAPGAPVSPGSKRGAGKSVRESLAAAMEELGQ